MAEENKENQTKNISSEESEVSEDVELENTEVDEELNEIEEENVDEDISEEEVYDVEQLSSEAQNDQISPAPSLSRGEEDSSLIKEGNHEVVEDLKKLSMWRANFCFLELNDLLIT